MYFVKENYVGGEKIMILKYRTWKAIKRTRLKIKTGSLFVVFTLCSSKGSTIKNLHKPVQ